MYAIDKLKDADDAVQYTERARYGMKRSLDEVHELLQEVQERVEEKRSQLLLQKALLIIEAHLDY